jgi:Skp family chaperone for outer membrane proteins
MLRPFFLLLLTFCFYAEGYTQELRVGVIDSKYLLEKLVRSQGSEQLAIKAANQLIASYAKDNNFSLIFQADKLHCFNRKLDITKLIETRAAASAETAALRIGIQNSGKGISTCSDNGWSILFNTKLNRFGPFGSIEFIEEKDIILKKSEVLFLELRTLAEGSKTGVALSEALKQEFQAREAEINKKRQELNSEKRDSPEWDSLIREINAKQQQFQMDLGKRRSELLKQWGADSLLAIRRYYKENGYSLIVFDAVWVNPELNRTAQTLEILK